MPDNKTLKNMPLREFMQLFRQLHAPALSQMNGEYRSSLLRQKNALLKPVWQAVLYNPVIGHWRCKAFRPVNTQHGRGYNSFSHRGDIVQRYPMHTLIAPSRYDGKPAYTLVYRAYHSACGAIHMVDEIRQLDEERFLGIGTCGFTQRQRMLPIPFLLSGPVAEYRGDIGRERTGFPIEQAIPASL